MVDNSTRFFWAASYGQIYPELRRLAEAGLIEGDRRRRVTAQADRLPAHRRRPQELRGWLRRPPTTFETRDEGLLKLFFAGALPPRDAVRTLEAMRGAPQETVARLREIEPMAIGRRRRSR